MLQSFSGQVELRFLRLQKPDQLVFVVLEFDFFVLISVNFLQLKIKHHLIS